MKILKALFLICSSTLVACASSNSKEIILSASADYAEKGAELAMIPIKNSSPSKARISINSIPETIYSSATSNAAPSEINIPIDAMLKASMQEVIQRNPQLVASTKDHEVIAKIQRISHHGDHEMLTYTPRIILNIVFEIDKEDEDIRYLCKKDVNGYGYRIALYDPYNLYIKAYSITTFTALMFCLDEVLQNSKL